MAEARYTVKLTTRSLQLARALARAQVDKTQDVYERLVAGGASAETVAVAKDAMTAAQRLSAQLYGKLGTW